MKLLFVSLGCDKNLVDSEHMMGDILDAGYEITDDEAEAEIVVVNTCCFIQDALTESIDTIISLGELKKTGKLKSLIITGCMAERFTSSVREDLPEVDAVVGTNAYDSLLEAIEASLNGSKPDILKPLTGLPKDGRRVLTTGTATSYLKIAEGCNKNCSYCVIPHIRGGYRSVPMDKLLKEAEYLAEAGVSELVLVAQETTMYGVDLYGRKSLHELVSNLCKIDGLKWIRIMYAYPEEIYDELIDVMASEEKVCHYIDMPIQHCNNDILKRMGRRTTKEDIVKIISNLRNKIPDICIRTSIICGFPGETLDNHNELLDFMREVKIDHLGAFAYSQEEGTPAAEFDKQLPEVTKDSWVAEVMELQAEISEARNSALVGRELKVIIEGRLPDEEALVGRTYRDAASVDGYVFLDSSYEINSGEYVDVVITGCDSYDLIGEILE